LIEESDGNKTKNQAGASPEPDVLMKNVECDDGDNQQDVFHEGQKLASDFRQCQEQQKGGSNISLSRGQGDCNSSANIFSLE